MKWRVGIIREWTEPGEIEVEAKTEDEAREIAQEMIDNAEDDSIEWEGSNMTQGETYIESAAEAIG